MGMHLKRNAKLQGFVRRSSGLIEAPMCIAEWMSGCLGMSCSTLLMTGGHCSSAFNDHLMHHLIRTFLRRAGCDYLYLNNSTRCAEQRHSCMEEAASSLSQKK